MIAHWKWLFVMLLALPALAQDRRKAVFTTAPYGGFDLATAPVVNCSVLGFEQPHN